MRLLVLLIIIFALLIIALVAVVQWVLWSDLPRSTIVRELQAETGLRFEAASSVTRWAGVTELRDVSIALPLEDEPFVRLPVLRVHHTPLVWMVAGFEVQTAVLEEPWIRLAQDEHGDWNVARALAIVQARQAGTPESAARPPIPKIEVRDGILDVPSPDGARREVPLAFLGEPEGPVSWAFEVRAGDVLAARGRVAPHGAWQHVISATFGDGQALLEAVVPEAMRPLTGAVHWQGALDQGRLAGRLKLDRFSAGEIRAKGEAELVAGDGGLVLRPRGLDVSSGEAGELAASLSSGQIRMEGSLAEVRGLRLEGMGTLAVVDGRWDLERESGEIAARWIGSALGPVAGHEGEAKLTAVLPASGPASIQGELRTSGAVAEGSWNGEVRLDLRGRSWQQMAGRFTAPRAMWSDEEGTIDVGGAEAQVMVDWPVVRLDRANVPGSQRSLVMARIDAAAQSWEVEGEIESWDIPRVRGGALDLLVRAGGDARLVDVEELRVRGAGFDARASGEYDLSRETPLRATTRIAYDAPTDAPSPAGGEAAEEPGMEIAGWLALAEVTGRLRPLNVRMQGEFQGRELRLGGAPASPVTIPFSGNATEQGAEFTSGRFDLLGGQWQLAGSYEDASRSLALQVEGGSVPLMQVAQLIEVPLEMPGTGAARVRVLVPGLDTDALEVEGEFTVADVDRPGLKIEQGRGNLVTRGGVLTLRDLELTAGEARLTGTVEYNLRSREDVRVDAVLESWPVSHEDLPVVAVLDGRAQVGVDLENMTLNGNVDGAADISREGMHIGRINTVAVLDGRRVDVQRIVGEVCSGTIEGRARFSIDDLLQSRAELDMQSVDIAELTACLGVEDEFAGLVSATVMLGPAADPRAPEPLALELRIQGADAAYRTVRFGGAEINAFFGPTRSLIDRSRIDIADGSMTLFTRLSRHEGDRFVHVQTNLDRLDIEQFYRAFAEEDEPLPGRLSGQAAFGGYIEEPHRMFGEARLAIRESDLANLGPIAAVYNLLNLQFGRQSPTGEGEIRVRLEGNALEITRMRYFNRGADVAASLRVEDVRLGGDSPISGVAAGSVRPLRELDLPLLDVDRMLSTLQSSAASVEIGGTLAERDIRVVPFAQIGGRIGRLLGGPVE